MKPYFLPPLFCQKLIWIPTRLSLRFFGHLEIKGLENLRAIKGNVIFAANHASEIDPFLVPASLPFWSRSSPLFYATREKSFYDTNGWRKHLFGGLFINVWGGYGVRVGLKNYARALKDHMRILRDGGSFCVFPEGGITPDGSIQPGKGGVIYMATQTETPVVPVTLSGAHRMSAADFFLRRRRITVHFGKPIYQKEFLSKVSDKTDLHIKVYKELATYVMMKIEKMLVKD